jgi:hypothetical protein
MVASIRCKALSSSLLLAILPISLSLAQVGPTGGGGAGGVGPRGAAGPAGPAPAGTGSVVVNSGVASAVAISGDGTLNPATGALKVTKTNGSSFSVVATSGSAGDLSTGTLPHARLPALLAGDIPANAANTSGNAATATALAGAPALCPAGSYTLGISVGGNAQNCTALPAFPSGAIVGTSDTQALTNKTVDGVSPATMGYLDATSSIQTQLGGKAASNASTTVNAQPCPLGGSCTVTVPIGTGVTGMGAGVSSLLATPTGANLAAALTTALPTSAGGTGGTGTFTGIRKANNANPDTKAASGTDYPALPCQITDTTSSNTAPSYNMTTGVASGTSGATSCGGPATGVVLTLSAASSPTLTGLQDGYLYTITVFQPGSGGPYTLTMPANVPYFPPMTATASLFTTFTGRYNAAQGKLLPAGGTSDFSTSSTVAAPSGSPGTGLIFGWCDLTDLDCEWKNASGFVFKGFRTGVDANPVTGQVTSGAHLAAATTPNSTLVHPIAVTPVVPGSTDSLVCSSTANITTQPVAFTTTYTLPAFTQTAGSWQDIHFELLGTSSVAAVTLSFTIKLDSTIVYTTAAGIAPANSLSGSMSLGRLHFSVPVVGASGSVYTSLIGVLGGTAGANVANRTSGPVTVDTTATHTISLLMQCGAATAGNQQTLVNIAPRQGY